MYQRTKLKLLNVLLSAGLALPGCFQQETKVSLEIEVKSNQGEPIAEAVIRVNGQQVGTSDRVGRFAGDLQLPKESRQKLEIIKESEEFYYAPYFDSFTVSTDDAQIQRVQATLYFVPKPNAEEERKVEESLATVQASSAVATTEAANASAPLNEKAEKAQDAATVPAQESPVLSHVDSVDKDGAPAEKSRPKSETLPERIVFNIHVYSGKNPVANANVRIGDDARGKFDDGCITNERGRCALRIYRDQYPNPTPIMVSAKSYQSQRQNVNLASGGMYRFNLPRGEMIDIFATLQTFQYLKGLAGVEVFVKGERVGETDSLGHFGYLYRGSKSDLLDIMLKSKNALPDSFETDFVVAGPMNLVRHYTPKAPPPVKLALWDVKLAGELMGEAKPSDLKDIENDLREAVNKGFYSNAAFQSVEYSKVAEAARTAGVSLSQILTKGWQSTELKAHLNAVLLPTIIMSGEQHLELSLIDSHGNILAAAKERLVGSGDKRTMMATVAKVAEKIIEAFPFEGAVIGKESELIRINLGFNSGRGVQVGDELDVYGTQLDKLGRQQLHAKTARIKVTKVGGDESTAKVISTSARSVVDRGDLVVMRGAPSREGLGGEVHVTGTDTTGMSKGIAQANIYFNEFWIGSTDETGRLKVPAGVAGKHGLVRIIKHGYRDFAREMTLDGRKRSDVQVTRESSYLQVESEPAGAAVALDGKVVGNTPIRVPIPVAVGFVKVKIGGLEGYKDFVQVMEFDQGTLDLTAGQAIKLERDLLGPARRSATAGRFPEAAELYSKIPETHSDYLLSQHELGEILLLQMKQPAAAAGAFARVTSQEAVRDFVDKRFIGSHINEGIALVLAAELLATSEPAAARAHLAKASEVLARVAPQIRFVSANEHPRAAHNVGYYQALSLHRMWLMDSNEAMVSPTALAWREYMEGATKVVPPASGQENYREHAEVYYNQVRALLENMPQSVANK